MEIEKLAKLIAKEIIKQSVLTADDIEEIIYKLLKENIK